MNENKMKKLVFTLALAAVLAIGGVSCSRSTSDTSAAALKSKIENCNNPDSVKVYVEQAKAYAQKLVKEGKIDQAREYLDKIEPAVKTKAPALAGTFATVNEALGRVTEATKDKADEAADKAGQAKDAASAATDSIASAASSAKDAVAQKAGEIKDAAAQKTEEVKDAAAQKVQQAKDATADAAQKGADKVKDLLK